MREKRQTGLEHTDLLLAAYLFSFRVLLDILRQLSHTKLVNEEEMRKGLF